MLLTGGFNKIKGFRKRLENELNAILPNKNIQIVRTGIEPALIGAEYLINNEELQKQYKSKKIN